MAREISVIKRSKIITAKDALSRTACNVSGKLGSLYNVYTDSFVKHQLLLREPTWYVTHESPRCTWWWFNEREYASGCLRMFGIEDELCLSLYLGLCSDKLNGRASSVNYEKTIDQQTIFLLYSYRTRQQWLPTDSLLASNFFPNGIFDKLDVDATHIVHAIILGFEVLFIVQVDNTIDGMNRSTEAARLLNKICNTINQSPSQSIELTQDEQNLWRTLNIRIQASSPDLTFDQPLEILPVIQRIHHFQDSWLRYHHPLIYMLQPVEWIYNTISGARYNYFEIDSQTSIKIQRQLYLLQNALNKLTESLQLLQETDKEQHLLRQSSDINTELQQLQQVRDELFRNLRSMLIAVRQNRAVSQMLIKILDEHQYRPLYKSTLNPLIEACDDLCNKARLINQLRKEHFEYLQITDDKTSSKQQKISNLFFNSIQPVFIVCSSDIFIRQDTELWTSSCQELIKKKSQNPNVRLIYADLSYCTHEDIKNTMIISSDSTTNKATSPSIPEIQEKTDINVLLLGETGVGKSTFINAFVNYLTFDSLEQAASSEPVVLIPVSFLLTTNDKLDEFIVKFGDVDANEDHDHPGQSVTQHCRSYVFDISDKLRLRFIDTPGVGDTRGIDQDQKNIDHILSYINNFPHINAVCILLQPNIKRLSVFFRSCLLQLFTYLTPAALDNIVFCFTNARSTFFAPGDTAPILKSFLKELPIAEIPFSRKNSFCFDSESFRYLAAIKNNLEFKGYEQENFDKSWTTSVTESERLLTFICQLKPYCMSQWQSEKHAELEVYTMVRPFMETFRKVVFTLILQQQQRNEVSIQLTPKPIEVPSAICYKSNCKFRTQRCDILTIVQYSLHSCSKQKNSLNQRCTSCLCDMDKHMTVEYELNHEFLRMPKPTAPIKGDDINWWLNLCVQFACFIGSDDTFILYFDRFIQEETTFAVLNRTGRKPEYTANVRMYSELTKIKKIFEAQVKIKSAEIKPHYVQIYQLITLLMEIPDIRSQIDAIKQGRSTILKNQEHNIPKPSRSTGILSRITQQLSNTY